MMTPRALDDTDHLSSRRDVDVLAREPARARNNGFARLAPDNQHQTAEGQDHHPHARPPHQAWQQVIQKGHNDRCWGAEEDSGDDREPKQHALAPQPCRRMKQSVHRAPTFTDYVVLRAQSRDCQELTYQETNRAPKTLLRFSTE